MLTSIQRRANIENFVLASGSMIQLPELREYVNEVSQELYDMLVAARAQEYFRKAYSFQTSPNVGEYILPRDLYQLLSVDLFIAPNQVLSARPYMEAERNRFRWYPGWYYNQPVFYRLLGSPVTKAAVLQPRRINFIPQPAAVNTIVLNYYPVFTPFATDGTEDNFVFDGINGWESYIIWKVAAICLEKMEQSSEFAMTRAEEVRLRVLELASDNDAGNAERIHDVAADAEPFGWSST
jgi:hypothetical protein